jgi:N-methylhydantoinase B
MYEQQTPHRIIKHEYSTDSAGAGRWRGGLGVETEIELGADDTTMVVFGDGDKTAPYGLFGGESSVLNVIKLKYPDGKEITPLSKDLISGIPKGSIYYQVASGGGGYGDPKLRTREKVMIDVKNGVVSKESAEKEYGIKF